MILEAISITQYCEYCTYALRESNIIYHPSFEKVAYGKNTFQYYGTHIWNLLANEIMESANISSLNIYYE